jgi:hypothetical protein
MTDVCLEQQVTKLTFAVLLIDDYSRTNPIGNVNVILKNREEKAIKNLSQYYLFLDLKLPNGSYILQAKSDYYLDTDLEFAVDEGNIAVVKDNVKKPIDPKNPLILMYLKPDTSYPLLNEATVIRGMLYDDSKNPIDGAIIKVSGADMDINTTTSEKGEFVLYFLPSIQKGIGINDKGCVEVNGNSKISLKVENIDKTIDLNEIKEFKTISIQIIGGKLYEDVY